MNKMFIVSIGLLVAAFTLTFIAALIQPTEVCTNIPRRSGDMYIAAIICLAIGFIMLLLSTLITGKPKPKQI